MRRNIASQVIGAQMVSASDGSAFTGTVTCYVTVNGGTQALGGTGSGVCTHEGNGYHTYVPTQSETNGQLVAFTFIGTGAVPATIQVFTSAYDANGRDDIGAMSGTTLTARDIGASVLLSPGTGTGQVNLTSGAVPVTGDLSATMKTSVNTEVLDVLNTDTFAQPGQEAPAATQTLVKMLSYLYKAFRNRSTQTSGGTLSLYNDDATTVDQKATVSDDGSTFDRGELGTGP